MPANFKAVGRNVFYRQKGTQRGVKILVHPGLNFFGERECHQGMPWRSENCSIHAGPCPPALTAFSLAKLRACDMHGVQMLSDVGLTLVPVHIVHASRVALVMNEGQGIPRCHLTEGQRPSETSVNGLRLRANLCFAGLFLILGQPGDTL